MDPAILMLSLTAVMIGLVVAGVHVAVALGLTSFIAVWLIRGSLDVAMEFLSTTFYRGIQVYEFGVVPLFVLMGVTLGQTRLSLEVFEAANYLLRRVRGSLAMATVLGNAGFAAVSGSSIASAAAFAGIAYRPMTALGYNRRFVVGAIAGSSVLGMLIPPSILLVVYGILTQVSIGQLFIAGVIPGMILAVMYCLGILLLVQARPQLLRATSGNPGAEAQNREGNWRILFRPWPIVFLAVLVLGGIYGGLFTPTEAGAVGAFGALVVATLKRELDRDKLREILKTTGLTTGALMLLLISAQMYSRSLALSGMIEGFEGWLRQLAVPSLVVLVLFFLVIIVLGMVVDSTSILLLVVPIAFPILTGFGYHPVWLGIVIVVAVELGLITPPFGLVAYTVKASLGDEVELEDVFLGSVPFLAVMVLFLALLVSFPVLTVWALQFM